MFNGDGGRSLMMRGGGVFGRGACLYIFPNPREAFA
jgi:hypothetical protein